MTTRLAILMLFVAAVAPAQCPSAGPGCGGCAQAAPASPKVEEEVHCHWLEVTGLVPGGVAEQAGVKVGSRLENYGGRTVGCLKDYNAAKAAVTTDSAEVVFTAPASTVRLTVAVGAPMGVYLKEWQKDTVFDKDAKVIEGLPALGWQTNKSNTFMAALAAVQQLKTGTDDYYRLCGASGAAFRLHFFDSWCPSSVDPSVGFNSAEAAVLSLGYRPTWLTSASDGKNRPQMVAAIRKSIDAGMPVVACDLREMPEWGVVTGYQKDGTELIGRTYFDKRKGYDIAAKFPMTVLLLEKAGKTPGGMVGAQEAARTVSTLLTTPKYGEYWSGPAAFDHWIERLRTDDFTKLDSARLSEVVQANYWIYQRLIDDRKTGIEYLNALAAEQPTLKVLAGELAALYEGEVAALEPFLVDAPCPGSVTRAEQWTTELREEQAGLLKAARATEEQALAVWQKLALAEK
jgi:hypothetical protein